MYAASVSSPSVKKNTVIPHLSRLSSVARPIRIVAFEPAPLYRQPVETDAAVQLDREQQDQIQRPPAAAPHAIRGFIRADVAGMHEHLVQMHGSQKEERETGHGLNPPERRILMAQHFPVAGETFVFVES